MSRFLKRRRASGFRTSDILRLMAMIGFLCVLGLSFTRFRDAKMWRWLFPHSVASQGAEADELARQKNVAIQRKQLGEEPVKKEAPQEVKADVVAESKAVATDESKTDSAATTAAPLKKSELLAEEAEFLKQELELVEDKSSLDVLEMGAYWRLVGWSKDQTSEEMDQRARRDIQFTHLWERPAKYRGQLVRLNLRLVRTLRYEAEKNRLGVDWLYEGWGTTTDSGSNPYVIVFADWPKGLPLGESLEEDVTVDAYFLKLFKYNSRDGKARSAPLLIGRLNWHRTPANGGENSTNIMWSGLVIVCGVVIVGLGIWVFRFTVGPPKLAALSPVLTDEDKVDDWLSGTTTTAEPYEWESSTAAVSQEPEPYQRSEHS